MWNKKEQYKMEKYEFKKVRIKNVHAVISITWLN